MNSSPKFNTSNVLFVVLFVPWISHMLKMVVFILSERYVDALINFLGLCFTFHLYFWVLKPRLKYADSVNVGGVFSFKPKSSDQQ